MSINFYNFTSSDSTIANLAKAKDAKLWVFQDIPDDCQAAEALCFKHFVANSHGDFYFSPLLLNETFVDFISGLDATVTRVKGSMETERGCLRHEGRNLIESRGKLFYEDKLGKDEHSMRQLSINRLQEGDILGRTIYANDGRVLLGKGMTLTKSYIERLKNLGVSILYIDDEESQDIEVKDVISEEHRRKAMASLDNAVQAVKVGKDFDGLNAKKNIDNIVQDLLFQKDIFISLTDMRTYDNQIFAHSVNVCVLSTILGKALGLNRESLAGLAVGALFHDIGTVKLPKKLLNKREPFTPKEADLYRTHANHGFDILRTKRELNLLSAHIAFQHHERLNGSGYPRHLEGEAIHQWAQIVGIANFYDNLVNDGPGHIHIPPHEACEILMGSAEKFFPKHLVIAFLKHIAAYPTGCTVKLSTGEIGIIVEQNKSLPMRPIVRVLLADKALARIRAKEYNLVEERTLFIKAILD